MNEEKIVFKDDETADIYRTYAQLKHYESVGNFALYAMDQHMKRSPVKGLSSPEGVTIRKMKKSPEAHQNHGTRGNPEEGQ